MFLDIFNFVNSPNNTVSEAKFYDIFKLAEKLGIYLYVPYEKGHKMILVTQNGFDGTRAIYFKEDYKKLKLIKDNRK